MQSPQGKLKEIDRLLSAFPAGNNADPEQALRNYLLAVEDYPWPDIDTAVTNLIKGIAPGIGNANFLPTPATVGAECRRVMNLRLDHEKREKARRPKLPPPDIEHDAASRARVKAMVDAVVAKLSEGSLREESAANRRAMIQRANERFDRERGFDVGDRIGHEDAA